MDVNQIEIENVALANDKNERENDKNETKTSHILSRDSHFRWHIFLLVTWITSQMATQTPVNIRNNDGKKPILFVFIFTSVHRTTFNENRTQKR